MPVLHPLLSWWNSQFPKRRGETGRTPAVSHEKFLQRLNRPRFSMCSNSKRKLSGWLKVSLKKRVAWIELCFIKRTKSDWLHRNVKNGKVWKVQPTTLMSTSERYAPLCTACCTTWVPLCNSWQQASAPSLCSQAYAHMYCLFSYPCVQ